MQKMPAQFAISDDFELCLGHLYKLGCANKETIGKWKFCDFYFID